MFKFCKFFRKYSKNSLAENQLCVYLVELKTKNESLLTHYWHCEHYYFKLLFQYFIQENEHPLCVNAHRIGHGVESVDARARNY